MQSFSVSRFMELSLSSHQAQIPGLMMDGILWAAAECVIWVDLLRAGEVLSSSETTLPKDEFLEAPDSQRQEDVEWRMEAKWRSGGKIKVKRRKSCHESCTERGKKLFLACTDRRTYGWNLLRSSCGWFVDWAWIYHYSEGETSSFGRL